MREATGFSTSIRVLEALNMKEVISLLAIVGACVGQGPANTYLSLVGSSTYFSTGPQQFSGHSPGSFRSGSTDPSQSDVIRNNSNIAIYDSNGNSAPESRVDQNYLADVEPAYYRSLLPQSRRLTSTRSQAIPSQIFQQRRPSIVELLNEASPQLSLSTSPFRYNSLSSGNRENPSLRIDARSETLFRSDPHQLRTPLFFVSAQTATERRPLQTQYQRPAFSIGAGLSGAISSSTFDASPLQRAYIDDSYPSYERPAGHSSNQNQYIQQNTQLSVDPVNYHFSYGINALEKGQSVQIAHEEQRNQNQAAGTYSVLLPDGKRQIVEYTADQEGYRPNVSYDNEVGPSVSSGLVDSPDGHNRDYESSIISARTFLNDGTGSSNIQNHYQAAATHSGSVISSS